MIKFPSIYQFRQVLIEIGLVIAFYTVSLVLAYAVINLFGL